MNVYDLTAMPEGYWVFTRYDRRTDQSDRPVGPTIGTCKHPVKLYPPQNNAVRPPSLTVNKHSDAGLLKNQGPPNHNFCRSQLRGPLTAAVVER